MILGVVGSRRRNTSKDFKRLLYFIERVKEKYSDLTLVSGGCRGGADRFIEVISEKLNIPIKIHYPDRSKLPLNPERYHFTQINYARNTLIAQDCDILLAMVADDRIGGTEDTIKKAEKLGKKVIII